MFLLASTAFAQTFSKVAANPTANAIITKIMNAIVIPVAEGFFLFTTLIFIWGVFGLIRNGDDPDARKDGQRHILWGVVGMFIMVSAYGIIRVIANTLGVGDPFS